MESKDPIFEIRRRMLIQALGAAAGGSLPGLLQAQSLLGGVPRQLPAGQSFYRISGAVTVDNEPANLGTQVRPGSTVETGDDSEAIFAVGTQAMLLRARSRVVIEAEPSPSDPVALVITGLRLLGKVLSVSRNSGMRVQTSTATIGIRGTGWYAESDPDLTYFCTCYGDTDVASTEDPTSRETINARQHDRPVYIAREGSAGGRIRSAPMINHTDQELALVEALVGRTPPFVFPRDGYNTPRRTY